MENSFGNASVAFSVAPYFTDLLSGADASTIEYSFDSLEGPWVPYSDLLDTTFLDEGTHNIFLRALDRADNRGTDTTGIPITIDRTVPVIQSLEVFVDGNLLEENSYSFKSSMEVVLVTEDFYGGGEPGALKGYNFSLATEPEADPGLSFFIAAGNPLYMNDMTDGIYYLYICTIIDGVLLVDTGSVELDGGDLLDFSNLGLTYEGISGEATISYFRTLLHGFTVTSSDVRLTPTGIRLNSASVEMPPQFGGGAYIIYNLLLRTNDLTVMGSGAGTGPLILNLGYGEAISGNHIIVTAQGFLVDTITVGLPVYVTASQGSLSFHDLPLYPDGTAGSSSQDENQPLTLGGFPVDGLLGYHNAGLYYNGASIQLPAGYYPGRVHIESLTLKKEAPDNPGRIFEYVRGNRDGWNFDIHGLHLTEEGLGGKAAVPLSHKYGYRTINFNNFKILPDGSYNTGASEDFAYLRIHDWMVQASGIELLGNTVKFGTAEIQLHSMMGWESLSIPGVTILPDDTIESGIGTLPVTFLSSNGFQVEAVTYKISNEGIYISGKVYFPGALGGEVYAEYPLTDILLEADGAIITPVPGDDYSVDPVTYYVAGWEVKGENYYFDREGLSVAYSTITLPEVNNDVIFPEIRFFADGEIKMAGFGFEGFSFTIPGTELSFGITEIGLNSNGVNAKAFIQLPPKFGADAVIYFDQLTIHPDGSISSDVIVNQLAFEVKGFAFDFRKISLSGEGFGIGRATITLPESMDYKQITISGLKITNEGDLVIGGINVDPFVLWGYTVYLDNLSFENDTVTLEGGVGLPTDFFIESLAGYRVDIDHFSYNFDNREVDFQISLNDTFSFKIMDKYDLHVTGVTVNKQFITIDEGVLDLPPDMNIGAVSVQGIVIDIENQNVDVAGVTITDIIFDFKAMVFQIDELTITETEGLLFRGEVRFSETFPIALAGNTVTVTKFQVTPDFQVGDVRASIDNLETDLFDRLDLTGGYVELNKIGESTTISATGRVLLGSKFPTGLAGNGADIVTLEIDMIDGGAVVTAFQARSLPIEFSAMGLDVENAIIGIVWDPGTETFTISLGGDGNDPARIVLAGDYFPDSIQDETVTISSFVFDTTPRLLELNAGIELDGSRELFNDIRLSGSGTGPATISTFYNSQSELIEFSIGGTLTFGDTYPGGIAGTAVVVDAVKFDTGWNLLDLDISVLLPGDLHLFDAIRVVDGGIQITKYNDDDFLFTLSGALYLPEDLPDGLDNLPIQVGAISLTSTGEIINVDITASEINTVIYGELSFVNGSLSVANNKYEGEDELLITIGGDLYLPEGLINEFSGMQLTTNIQFSTLRGLIDFNAGLAGGVQAELYPGLNAEFGTFNNNSKGFKGFVSLYIVGTVGVFVSDKGKISFGDVSKFVLSTPSSRVMNKNIKKTTRFLAMDVPGNTDKEIYNFFVPGPGSGSSAIPKLADGNSSLPLNAGEGDTLPGDETLAEKFERIIFMIGYTEGEPMITAISPSGTRYTEGDANVEVTRTEWGKAMVVFNGETGDWTTEVANVISPDLYQMEVYGKNEITGVTLDSPGYTGKIVSGLYHVEGLVSNTNNPDRAITIHASTENGTYLGQVVAETTTDSGGFFSTDIDTSLFEDGEYYIFARVESLNDSTEVKAFAPGSIIIMNHEILLGVDNLIATDNPEGMIELQFSDPNGERTKGYNIYLDNLSTGKSETLWIGPLKRILLPGFPAGEQIRIKVTAVDSRNRESAPSLPVTITMNETKQIINTFNIIEESVDVNYITGTIYEGSVNLEAPGAVVMNTAYDYAEVLSWEAPEKMTLGFTGDSWNLTTGPREIGFVASAEDSLAQGTYPVTVTFANKGNKAITDTVLFNITVTYPDPSIDTIIPATWLEGTVNEIEIFGDNFIAGTRVFFNDTELTVDESSGSRYIKSILPVIPGEGTHVVKILGPAGQEALYDIEVFAPYYITLVHKAGITVQQGAGGVLTYSIEGVNGFDGPASFTASTVPEGLTVDVNPSSISPGETLTVRVTAATDLTAGEYAFGLDTDQGESLNALITVTETPVLPHISSFYPMSAIAGEQLTIYGYAFGNTGTVYINGQSPQIISYSDGTITVVVPDDAVDGTVTVVNGTGSSEDKNLFIKTKYFNIYPAGERIYLQPGEDREIEIAVNGYTASVNLTTVYDESQLTAQLDDPTITPNGMTSLRISAGETIENGSYPIEIRGVSGTMIISRQIVVEVGEAFAFATNSLPGGMEGTGYLASLETVNGAAPVVYNLESGYLPGGLTITRGGIIKGKPGNTGIFSFTIEATDLGGRVITKDYTITVEESAWSHGSKDAGNSNYNPVPAPADNRRLWSTGGEDGAREIITGGKRLYLLTHEAVVAFERASGGGIWRIRGSFTEWAYADENLYLLDANGIFSAVDGLVGNTKWIREGITTFMTDGSLLYLKNDTTILLIDPETGMLIGTNDAPHEPDHKVFFAGNTPHKVFNAELFVLDQDRWYSKYFAMEFFHAGAADSNNIVVITGGGILSVLDMSYIETGKTETGISDGNIALKENSILVAGDSTLKSYNRETLEEEFTVNITINEMGAAAEKIFTVSADGLTAVNGYDGNIIWQSAGNYIDLAIAGEYVYGLNDNGQITCFNGPDNLFPPATVLSTIPGEPEGENNWFTSIPTLVLTAKDRESFVGETLYKLGSDEQAVYTGPFELPEGQNSFVTYSKDSNGLREADIFRLFKVDATPPETAISLSGTKGPEHYYYSGVTATITALDSVSGVAGIEYKINDGDWTQYFSPFTLTDEGDYSIVYRALDHTGSYSIESRENFAIDLFIPWATHITYNEPGLGIVNLEAFDSFSGIDRIAYYIGDNFYPAYTLPIALTGEGTHIIRYTAIDNSGRLSPERSVNITIEPFATGEWISGLTVAKPLPGFAYIRNIHENDFIYGATADDNNHLKSLPEYILGADYIQTSAESKNADGEEYIVFTAEVDIDVYIFKHKDSPMDQTMDLSDWILVDENYPVEPVKYFTGGADIYKKLFQEGEEVRIAGPNTETGWPNLIFIQYAMNNYIKILSPFQGQVFLPSSTLNYYGEILQLTYSSKRWHYSIDYGEWVALGTGINGAFLLPYVDDHAGIRLKLSLFDEQGNPITDRILQFNIINPAEIKLESPLDSSVIGTGETVELFYSGMDMHRDPLPLQDIVVEYSMDDGASYVTMTDNFLPPREEFGAVKIRMSATFQNGHSIIENFTIYAADLAGGGAIDFGAEGTGDYCTGEVMGMHPSGKVYGFSIPHTAETYKNGETREGFIRLQPGENFSFRVAEGTYTVNVTLGPLSEDVVYTVMVNGEPVEITGMNNATIKTVELTVNVNGGIITIEGSGNLPLMRIEVIEVVQTAVAGAYGKSRSTDRDRPPDELITRCDEVKKNEGGLV